MGWAHFDASELIWSENYHHMERFKSLGENREERNAALQILQQVQTIDALSVVSSLHDEKFHKYLILKIFLGYHQGMTVSRQGMKHLLTEM